MIGDSWHPGSHQQLVLNHTINVIHISPNTDVCFFFFFARTPLAATPRLCRSVIYHPAMCFRLCRQVGWLETFQTSAPSQIEIPS